jgi:HEAT repeat protein
VCREAANILCEIFGKPAVEPLIGALKHENMVVRANAAYILGEIGDERAVLHLVEALGDEHECVRYAAAQVLDDETDCAGALICCNASGEIEDASTAALMRQLLSGRDEAVRDAAAGLLETIEQRSKE